MKRMIYSDSEKFGENTDAINHVADEARRALTDAIQQYKLMPRVLRYLAAWKLDDDAEMTIRYNEMSSEEQYAAYEAVRAIRVLTK